VVFIFLSALHLFLYARSPEASRDGGWPTIVMHNWHEYGYWQMDGQLVANPGGLAAGEEKFIYPGHRPTFLIVPYLLKELPGAAFGDGLLYDFIVVGLVYTALLWLLGMNLRGILIACAVCLAPGFFNNIMAVDTISIPALLGVAAMAFVGGALVRDEAGFPTRVAAFLVMVAYMLLNWSTLFPLGVAAVYVLCRRPDWKKTAGYFAGALVVGLGVLAVSMHSRHATAANSGNFWNSYLWGPLGYDRSGMNLGKAFVRITAVNAIAWFPVVFAGLAVLLTNGPGEKWRRAAWPLLAGIAAVFTLRNYNAHHPWNAVCEIGLGLVFSLELLTGPKTSATGARRLAATGTTALFSTAYLIAWLALNEFNSRDLTAVRVLVDGHTPRHALVVVADGLLPAGVKDLQPFTEEFDRKLISLEEWNRPGASHDTNQETFLLTHTTTVPGAVFLAQSSLQPTWADKIMVPLFDFYRTKISRRAAGNRKEYFDEYKLYRF
jgi:hypothetical protein